MSLFGSPIKMGSWYRNRVMASSKSVKCSSVEGRRYALMSGVRLLLATISKLDTFGLWKRVNSMIHTFGRYQKIRPNPPCTPLAYFVISRKHNTPYPNMLWHYAWSVTLVSIITMKLKPLIYTAWMASASPNPCPLRML